SGKGGVGKSTVSVNLAVALNRIGRRAGLLDADIYGPSIPTMMGVRDAPDIGPDDKLIPPIAHGAPTMSIGYLVDPDQAMIWRGPMISSALTQMLRDVAWGELDILVIDMPPGTGDVQLTIAQRAALAGAVIVSTPQEVALADARRALTMFEKTKTPILGVVENMAYFEGPDGARTHIFGQGGARRTAEAAGAPFLGEVPLLPDIRAGGDGGEPAAAGDGPAARLFIDMAEQISGHLDAGLGLKPPPKIIIES
ncbi:MAG: Mrp/NBP35 family ATP-binding protein, partial [Pseudomonadota bacterium]